VKGIDNVHIDIYLSPHFMNEKQNELNRGNQLPELELGIGICYAPEAPKFLYDADDRIMISSAIGDADRLSSCSWKLRHKYSRQSHLLTQAMIFQQASI
jgi:hypothetical protein